MRVVVLGSKRGTRKLDGDSKHSRPTGRGLIWYIQHELDIKLTFNFLHLYTSVYFQFTTRIKPVGYLSFS